MATDDKPTEEEVKELEAQIKHDQEKPVAEHERRVRIGGTFDDAVKTMAQALEDSSLSVEISSVDYDEEAEDYDSLTADDAKAVIEYFFSGDQND